MKTMAVIAVFVAVLVYLHEVGRTQRWKSVQTIDQTFADIGARIGASF